MSVSEDSWSRYSSENSSKMETLHSSSSQCCCCVVAVLVSFGGVIMTSIGVCFILNYDMLNINLDILAPDIPDVPVGERKKIIGIILICFGITGIIISSLVSILFFTICHTPPSPQTIAPMYYDTRTKDRPYYVSNGVTPSRPNGRPSGAMASSSTPRRNYNNKKKKMSPPVLESVKEDPIGPSFPNPLPILQINGIDSNGSVFPMRDISLGSFRSQNPPPTLGNNHLQTDATPSSVDIATIQVSSQTEKKDSEIIHSSKL